MSDRHMGADLMARSMEFIIDAAIQDNRECDIPESMSDDRTLNLYNDDRNVLMMLTEVRALYKRIRRSLSEEFRAGIDVSGTTEAPIHEGTVSWWLRNDFQSWQGERKY